MKCSNILTLLLLRLTLLLTDILRITIDDLTLRTMLLLLLLLLSCNRIELLRTIDLAQIVFRLAPGQGKEERREVEENQYSTHHTHTYTNTYTRSIHWFGGRRRRACLLTLPATSPRESWYHESASHRLKEEKERNGGRGKERVNNVFGLSPPDTHAHTPTHTCVTDRLDVVLSPDRSSLSSDAT